MSHLRSKFMLVVVLALMSCGDPLIGPSYLGEPIFELEGSIQITDDITYENVQLALVWTGNGQSLAVANSVAKTKLPASFELAVFDEPAAESLEAVPGHETAKFALGRIIAYIDENQTGELELGEAIIGGTENSIVTFFTEDGGAEVVSDFRSGFNVAELVPCEERSSAWITNSSIESVRLILAPFDIESFGGDIDCDQMPDDICFENFLGFEEARQQAQQDLELVYQSNSNEQYFENVMTYQMSYESYSQTLAMLQALPEECVDLFGGSDCDVQNCLPEPNQMWVDENLPEGPSNNNPNNNDPNDDFAVCLETATNVLNALEDCPNFPPFEAELMCQERPQDVEQCWLLVEGMQMCEDLAQSPECMFE